MKTTPTAIPGVLIIEPKVFGDARGFFYESFNQKAFNDATGTDHQFVQDNHSRSAKGVLRGLHYQVNQPQGKLVRVVRGAVLTSPSIFAQTPQPLAAGSALSSPKATTNKCGCRPASHTGFWC